MQLVPTIKRPVKRLFTAFPMLDCFCRRFVWRYLYRRLYFHDAEMEIIHRLPKGSIDIAVDVGAAMGSYSWILDGVSSKVIAFEPGATHGRCLERMSFLTNIEVVRKAVGDTEREVNFFTPGDDSAARYIATVSSCNPIIYAGVTRTEIVEQTTLDTFFRDLKGRRIDLIKVDVEGYEIPVFTGAVNVLERYHPLVICEIEARHNPKYSEVFSVMRGLGYNAFYLQDGHFLSFNGDGISDIQTPADLETRLHGGPPAHNRYINNFIFQHALSHVKLAP